MDHQLQVFENKLKITLESGSFVKLSLGNYKGEEPQLKNIYIKKSVIKRGEVLAFNYRYQTNDIHKNFDLAEGVKLIMDYLSSGFKIASLFTNDTEIIFEYNKKGVAKIKERALTEKLEANLAHDKEKQRLIKADAGYLQKLGLTGTDGIVFKSGQDKYKQINQYIEIIHSLLKDLPADSIHSVADMGAGKGYLTFALYDYLQKNNPNAKVTGVEFRKDLVELCNQIAADVKFKGLNFVEGTIEDYKIDSIDLLIALHACDTATDDAIAKGVKANAKLIVVAPCCHKQIRREIEKGKQGNDVSFLTKYGVFLERQAEMVTDGIRALILNYFGYKTKILEFIADAHTPKNVMIIGVKGNAESVIGSSKSKNQAEVLTKIEEAKAFFGIQQHYLEKLLL